jgi:hypothetical protein
MVHRRVGAAIDLFLKGGEHIPFADVLLPDHKGALGYLRQQVVPIKTGVCFLKRLPVLNIKLDIVDDRPGGRFITVGM